MAKNKDYSKYMSQQIEVGSLKKQNMVLSASFLSSIINGCYVVGSLEDSSLPPTSQRATGDVAIVSAEIDDGVVSRTAYYWDGTNWIPMDGNYDADNVFMPENMVLTYDFGKYTTPDSGSYTLPCKGMSVKEMLNDAFAEVKSPDVVQPSITFTLANTTLTGEVGSKFTVPTATLKFNTGSYQYSDPQYDTGVKVDLSGAIINCTTNGEFTKNSTVLSNDDSFSLSASTLSTEIYEDDEQTYSYNVVVSHTEGSVPKNNIGNNDTAKQIKATTSETMLTDTKTCKATGHRFGFFGYRTATDGALNLASLTSENIREQIHAVKWDATNGSWPSTFIMKQGAIQLIFAVPENAKNLDSHKYIKMNNTARGDWPSFDNKASGMKSALLRDINLNVDGAAADTPKKYLVWTSTTSVPFGEDDSYSISYKASAF